jgi:hypothetical protein
MRFLRHILVLGSFVACTSAGSSTQPPAPPAWSKSLIASTELAAPRSWQLARGVIHFHSTYSHDACDNWWRGPDGSPKTPADFDDTIRGCDAQMRQAVCSVGQDFVFMTDHPAHMADFDFDQLFHFGPGDEHVIEDGKLVANRVACENGRRPLLFVGHEDAVMSLGIHQHLDGAPAERLTAYGGSDAATIAALHAAGGLVNVAHTESKTLEYLRATPLDGLEVYNLHANIDPKIRPTYLGLDPLGFFADLLDFSTPSDDAPEPDLAMLSFLSANDNARAKWDALLTERDMVATAGTDVHQNSVPGIYSDGERGDGYRRLMRWISNNVLVTERSPAAIRSAIAAGRLFTAFDVLGSPVGFDFAAAGASATTEMGGHVSLSARPTLQYRRPRIGGVPVASGTEPVMHARLFMAKATGGVEVAASDGDLSFVPTEPGAYRLEVSITAAHLAPFLGHVAAKYVGRTYPWIYSNAIHVDP